MRRRPPVRSVPGVLPRLVLAGAVLLVAAGLLRDGEGERPRARIPDPPARGVPPQFAEIVAGMKAAQRLPFMGAATAAPAAKRPFADRGSPRQVARVRRDVARALRRASTPDDRVSVAAWQGIYVSGRRAVALVDLRRAVRSRRGMPFRRLPPARTRFELVRRGRSWLLV